MADIATAGSFAPDRKSLVRSWLQNGTDTNLDRMVTLWIFMGGFTIVEPSPYEFFFALVVPFAIFARIKIYRPIAILFVLMAAFTPFAVTAAFQATYTPLTKTILYPLISIFLMLTAFFVANYVAEKPQERLRRIIGAYTAIALLSSLLGIGGYLHIIPGGYDILTRYGRAKALFEDPNVFAPFLILPAVFATQRLLLNRGRRSLMINGTIIMVLLIGVFVSFSRAAWGNLLGSTVLLFIMVFAFEANAREKVRMLILGMVGAAMAVSAIAGLLSIPSVGELFETRFQVEQSYDSGENGRFGRQGYAFDVGLSNPLGIGPAEFRNLKIPEEAHDTFATTIHVYGWGGALVWDVLMALTLWRGFSTLIKPSPNRRLLIPLLAVFLPHVIESGIIDIDHWRHYYLIMGLIWGVTTGYRTLQRGESKVTAIV